MSCSEQLQGSYTINNKREFTKVVKAMIAAANERIDYINSTVKSYKRNTKNRSSVDWRLVDQCVLTRWKGNGYNARIVPTLDTSDWDTRNLIEYAIKRVAKLAKITKNNLDVNDMTIDFEGQYFSINVGNENHAVEVFNSQGTVQAFWKALKEVKWQQRGGKDGGYCEYNCEYQDSPNQQDYFGKRGDDMFAWANARPMY